MKKRDQKLLIEEVKILPVWEHAAATSSVKSGENAADLFRNFYRARRNQG